MSVGTVSSATSNSENESKTKYTFCSSPQSTTFLPSDYAFKLLEKDQLVHKH